MPGTIGREVGQLQYPYGSTSTDEEVLAAVLNALHHHSGVPSDHIRAEIHDGQVVLSGKVAREYEKTLAEQAAAATPGVAKVKCLITLEG